MGRINPFMNLFNVLSDVEAQKRQYQLNVNAIEPFLTDFKRSKSGLEQLNAAELLSLLSQNGKDEHIERIKILTKQIESLFPSIHQLIETGDANLAIQLDQGYFKPLLGQVLGIASDCNTLIEGAKLNDDELRKIYDALASN